MNSQTSHLQKVVIELFNVEIGSTLEISESEISDIDWKVRATEFWVVGGIASNVKSNFVMTVAGLQKPVNGLVLVLGHNFQELTDSELVTERCRVGTVFPRGGRMLKGMTVLENVALPLQYHFNLTVEEASAQAMEVIEKTGLKTFTHKVPANLATSWQQRVGLARALALAPEILLVDRPFERLEFRHRRWWFDFLHRLSQQQIWPNRKACTVVVTTDDLRPWADHASHLALVRDKKFQAFQIKTDALNLLKPEAQEISSDDLLADF